MKFEFAAPNSRNAKAPTASTARLVNCYREFVGGDAGHVVRQVPGVTTFKEMKTAFCRDILSHQGWIYTMTGSDIVRMLPAGLSVNVGSVADGTDGIMSANGTKLAVVAGGRYYVADGLTLSEPSAGAFSDFGSVDYSAGRTILTEKAGARFCWSDIGAPETLNALNFASAEQFSDNLIRPIVTGGSILLLGEESTEVWGPTGQGGTDAFALLPGAVRKVGLKSHGLVAKAETAAFLVGSDNIVYIASGMSWQPVSTPAVHDAITDGNPTRCAYYEHGAHKFGVITFTDRPSWVYDITTGEWHERGCCGGPWGVVAAARHDGIWYCGEDTGVISTMGGLTDNGAEISREIVSPLIDFDGPYRKISKFRPKFGRGEQVLDRETKVMVSVSPDGRNWGPERIVPIGWNGDGARPVEVRNLGRWRSAAIRLRFTDPVDVPVYSVAQIEVV